MATSKPAQVRATHNFMANLDEVGEFLLEVNPEDAPRLFALLKLELDELVTLLEAHPAIGRPARFEGAHSIQGHTRATAVRDLAQHLSIRNLREYVLKDYVILYACTEDEVILLAVKHHRQLRYRL